MFLQHHHCQSQLVYACASLNISYPFPSFLTFVDFSIAFSFQLLEYDKDIFRCLSRSGGETVLSRK